MNKATVKDIDLKNKKVLMRVDFNVPLKDGEVTDNTRIVKALKTIRYVLDQGASLVLMSHLGRPKGEVKDSLKMDPVSRRLSQLLGKPVTKLDDCVGPAVEAKVNQMKPGDVVLLENTRFHKEEKKNNPEFAEKLARLGEVFVNDAFGTAHRAHASTEGVAKHLPAVAGFLLETELEELGRLLEAPQKPFIAILGGAKVSDKIGVIDNLAKFCNAFIIGGGMCFTFLKAKGMQIGKSLLDPDLESVRKVMKDLEEKGVTLALPVDVMVCEDPKGEGASRVVSADSIPPHMLGVDIGPETIKNFIELIKSGKTIFWNGPMGIFEVDEFAKGTMAVAQALADTDAVTVIGGGDSVAAVAKAGVSDKMTHISTGGGASLEFMEGKTLPGVAALMDKTKVKA